MEKKNKMKSGMMNVGRIVIEEDGWVWVETRQGGHEIGLGDLDVDVIIHDKRKDNDV